jgi:hypothetical protein
LRFGAELAQYGIGVEIEISTFIPCAAAEPTTRSKAPKRYSGAYG